MRDVVTPKRRIGSYPNPSSALACQLSRVREMYSCDAACGHWAAEPFSSYVPKPAVDRGKSGLLFDHLVGADE